MANLAELTMRSISLRQRLSVVGDELKDLDYALNTYTDIVTLEGIRTRIACTKICNIRLTNEVKEIRREISANTT